MAPTTATIIAAIITAIIGPILTWFVKTQYDRRFLETLSPARQKSLTGKWKGKLWQNGELNAPPNGADITLDLVATRKLVTGVVFLEVGQHKMSFKASGGMQFSTYLKLDYNNVKGEVIHFGTGILRLSANANVLEGSYCAYGAINERIVDGHIKLTRQELE